jgi:hypothetical protein
MGQPSARSGVPKYLPVGGNPSGENSSELGTEFGRKKSPVKSHEFGLRLSAEDKRALIAFLKTL